MFNSLPNHIKEVVSDSNYFYLELRSAKSLKAGGIHVPTVQVILWGWDDEHKCKYIRDALEYRV